MKDWDLNESGQHPKTLGELKSSGYQPFSIREEMRANLIARLESGEPLFPGIVGYEQTVTPKIENAVLSGHDMIFLGERGQGKTRIIRALVGLLDEIIPIVRGSEVTDCPFNPISRFAKSLVAEQGDNTEIEWIQRDTRYAEKLATPDTTTAELIGEIDPIKVAEGRYLADELTVHYGLIPRANRGIFAINELPDLAEKVQVSLFNILEERDIQIKGYKIRMPLDVLVVATANPEDYTSRGRIITPLKDRYSSHIRTHYPEDRAVELKIIDQEAATFDRGGKNVIVPVFMREIIAETTFQARNSPDVNQISGVSVRMSISNMESMVANAEKRSIRNKEREIVPRITDLIGLFATTDGKLELEYGGKEKTQNEIIEHLIDLSVADIFNDYLNADDLELLVNSFNDGWWVEVSDSLPAEEYVKNFASLKGMRQSIAKLNVGESPGEIAAAIEFILEGLHLNNKLNKEILDGKVIYNEAHKIQPLGRNSEMV